MKEFLVCLTSENSLSLGVMQALLTTSCSEERTKLMEKVNLAEKFAQFHEHWRPKVVGELNGQEVKLVKFKGTFVWHHHEVEDELFLVIRGCFRVEFRDRTVELRAGEFLIVPYGVEHRTVA